MADVDQNQQSLHVHDIENMPINTDEVHQVVLNAGSMVHATEMVDGTQVNVEAGVTEDILQQALEEAAAGGFDVENATVEYHTENGEEHQFVTVADGLTLSDLGDGNTYTIVNSENGEQILTPYTIGDENQVTQFVNVSEGASLVRGSQHIHEVVELPNVSLPVQLEIPEDTITDPCPIETEQSTGSGSLLNVDSGAPLGSSDNPIRIVQQGNQYTSVQQLTPEQLTHIMQVLQQQQVAKATQEAGSSTLFNPQTNTKIVYRVIYPSDLHNSASDASNKISPRTKTILGNKQLLSVGRGRGRGRPRKHPLPEDDDRLDMPELSREEKDARKKQRPRTRSGRVSKPPKHMMKDYKHIHILDWEEDYDDDDGGYSDYKEGASEDEEDDDDADSLDSSSFGVSRRARQKANNRCQACGKGYIGRPGLARHYKLNPDHGTLEEETLVNDEMRSTPIANGMVASPASSICSTAATTSMQAESNQVPAVTVAAVPPSATPAMTFAAATTASSAAAVPTPPVVKRGPGRPPKSGALTGRAQNLQRVRQFIPKHRKTNLREYIKQCEDEELMEVVLPRLAKAITLWEFLMMKSEKGRPLKPCIPDIVNEFESLQKQVQKVCQQYLKPAAPESEQPNSSSVDAGPNKFQLTNETIAKSLGLSVGSYDVMEVPTDGDSPFQYKYLTSKTAEFPDSNTAHKRTIQIVHPEDLIDERPSKRIRLHTDENGGYSGSSITNKLINSPIRQPLSKINNGLPSTRIHVVRAQSDTETSPSSSQAGPSSVQTISAGQGSLMKPVTVQLSDPTTGKIIASEDIKITATPTTATMFSISSAPSTVSVSGVTDAIKNSVEFGDTNNMTNSVKLEAETEHSVGIKVEPSAKETEAAVANGNGLSTLMEAEGVQVVQEEGGENQIVLQMEDDQVASESDPNQVQIFQTPDGVILVQKPDGTVLQIQHPAGEPIPLETVQALLAMDGQGALEAMDEAEVVEQ